MSYPKPPVPCPQCRELIHPEAKRCKHCHAELTIDAPKPDRLKTKLNTFRLGFITGIVLSVLLALAIYIIASR